MRSGYLMLVQVPPRRRLSVEGPLRVVPTRRLPEISLRRLNRDAKRPVKLIAFEYLSDLDAAYADLREASQAFAPLSRSVPASAQGALIAALARVKARDNDRRRQVFDYETGLFRDPNKRLSGPEAALAHQIAAQLAIDAPRGEDGFARALHPYSVGLVTRAVERELKTLRMPTELAPEIFRGVISKLWLARPKDAVFAREIGEAEQAATFTALAARLGTGAPEMTLARAGAFLRAPHEALRQAAKDLTAQPRRAARSPIAALALKGFAIAFLVLAAFIADAAVQGAGAEGPVRALVLVFLAGAIFFSSNLYDAGPLWRAGAKGP
ncbi:MAG: hypothetical protein GC199_11500 [Alphaproteobacteria bacterium]|nr:hypothetical protein [Alphaproteobacteria bacterium]